MTKPTGDAPLTMSVPEAGKKYFDLSRRLLRVPVRAMEQRLEAVCRERNGERAA